MSKTCLRWLPLDWRVYVTCDGFEDITEYENGSRFKGPCRGHKANGPGKDSGGPDPGPSEEEEGDER
jgi:hypothetical protein